MDECKTVEELKKVFKQLALKHHPDKGGDSETFNKIREEYEKRLAQLTTTEQEPEDDITLQVSLEEAYTGFVKVVPVITESRCLGCSQMCPMCHGKGNLDIHLGPFSLAHPCGMCEGRGGSHPSGCSGCKHTGKVVRRRDYKVTGHPGINSGDRISRFIIDIKKHPSFERKGHDLYTTVKIGFQESIRPITFSLKHLTKTLTIDTSPWVPIDPRIHHVVKGQGMSSHGDLHIIFDIQYKHGNISA